MNANEKRRLSAEAKMQAHALKIINRWKNIALISSAIGVTITYYGMTNGVQNLLLGIFGIIIIAASSLIAVVLNLGLKNGRRNVGKILNILDGGGSDEVNLP